MIKKLLILLLFTAALYAQQEQTGTNQTNPNNQNVELPEFVITGVERVSIPAEAKPKADLVPTLEQGFFRPEIPTTDLQVAELSNPIQKNINFFDYNNDLNGNLILGVGAHTLPEGSFYYGKKFEHALVAGKVWGINEFPDTTFSSRNNSGIGLNSSFFISDNSSFLPGTKFSLNGLYSRDTYKFFASNQSNLKRDINNGNFSLDIQNLLNNNVKAGVNTSENITYLKDTDLTENIFGIGGFLEVFYKDFLFDARINYNNQQLKDNLINNRYGFFKGSIIAGIKTPELVKVKIGFNFASSKDSKLFLPYGYLAYKFSKFFSAYAEFNPHADLVTVSDLIKLNRYYDGSPFNLVQRNEGASTFAIKYEYYTYFEINGGLTYNLLKDAVYFADDNHNGIFETRSLQAKSYGAFVNFMFHLGPYGSLYSGLVYNNLKDLSGKFIPYTSPFKLNLDYTYKFANGLAIESGLDIYSRRYADLQNNFRVPEYVDLSFKLEYEIFKNFNIFSNLTNLLNHKNYEWQGFNSKFYKGKPFDIVFGIDYSF